MVSLFITFKMYNLQLADWVGFLGVSQVLLAYLLNISGKVGTDDHSFRILNFTGASMAFLASWLLQFWPFMLLEGVWSVISFKSLIKKSYGNIMAAETNLFELIANMNPCLNEGDYVFVSISDFEGLTGDDVIGKFREEEGTTVILKKDKAVQLELSFDVVMSWITLKVHSSLKAIGLTAAFSSELANHGISCNVVAGYYHDHIFVSSQEAQNALKILKKMTKKRHRTQ